VTHQATQDLQPALTSNIAEAGMFLHTEGNLDAAPDLQFSQVQCCGFLLAIQTKGRDLSAQPV